MTPKPKGDSNKFVVKRAIEACCRLSERIAQPKRTSVLGEAIAIWRTFALALLVFAMCWRGVAMAGDYVFVVDTSGSMASGVSRADNRIRVRVVQDSLRGFFIALPDDSRVYLISFNSGVVFQQEVNLRVDPTKGRQTIARWIDSLETDTRKDGRTFLCSTLRMAFQKASGYAAEHPGEPVRIWALTDGMDNELGPENQTSERLKAVINEFPALDEKSVKADLVVLGDQNAYRITSSKKWLRVTHDPEFTHLVPPVIQVFPPDPKAGELVKLSEDSVAGYQFYDWRIDGKPVDTHKTFTRAFANPGTYTIHLIVTASNGDKLTDTRQLSVRPKDEPVRPTADFVMIPSSPEPGDRVQFIGTPKGNPTRFAWFIDGRAVSDRERTTNAFSREGRFEVKFRVEDATGASDEKTKTIVVSELPLHPRIEADGEAQSGQRVRFSNETTGGKAVRYEWDFGDGTTSSETEPVDAVHVFNVTGTNFREFNVILHAFSRMGKTFSSEPHRLKVLPPGPPPPKPKAAFSVVTNRVRVGVMIAFKDESDGLMDRNRTTWTFDAEGTLQGPQEPEFAFRSPGEKEVTLTVFGPGGSDSVTQRITVLKPELSIVINWIDAQGQNAGPPNLVNFDEVPPAHVQSGEYHRPPFDTFDVTIPADLPTNRGLDISVGETGTNVVEIVRQVPDSDRIEPVSGTLRKSGRYRLRIRPHAAEGSYSNIVTFAALGHDVLLNGQASPIQIPVVLRIGMGGPPWILIAFLALALALLALKILKRHTPFPLSKKMEAVLQEVNVGPDGKPVATQVLPSKTFVLSRNHRIHLGASPGLSTGDHVFDLGMPLGFLLRHTNGLMLHRPGGKDELLNRNREFSVTDSSGKKRNVRLAMRVITESKAGKPSSHK